MIPRLKVGKSALECAISVLLYLLLLLLLLLLRVRKRRRRRRNIYDDQYGEEGHPIHCKQRQENIETQVCYCPNGLRPSQLRFHLHPSAFLKLHPYIALRKYETKLCPCTLTCRGGALYSRAMSGMDC